MPDKPVSNVKIYERPERKGPSPLILVIGLLITLLVIFLLYKAFYHPALPANPSPGMISVFPALWQEKAPL